MNFTIEFIFQIFLLYEIISIFSLYRNGFPMILRYIYITLKDNFAMEIINDFYYIKWFAFYSLYRNVFPLFASIEIH